MAGNSDLGRFLRSRRASVAPEQVGLPRSMRRRVPGLRREEVAQLAGISVEYYVRLEQGRATRPSSDVLDALAGALDLTDVELAHLHDLALLNHGARNGVLPAERIRPELANLLAYMAHVPAFVLNHRLDLLAWNSLAEQLHAGLQPLTTARPNVARLTFLEPAGRNILVDWESEARAMVAQLRLTAGRYPGDALLASLLKELAQGSELFRRLWARRDVQEKTHGHKHLRHPVIGELDLRHEHFDLPGSGGQRLVVFYPDPGSPSETSLRLLALWTDPAQRPHVPAL